MDVTGKILPFRPSDRVWAYLQLLRPANIVTAWADILAGYAASGSVLRLLEFQRAADWGPLTWLLLATTGLYGGGVVLNDRFDAELDAQERPERPIPSGRASRRGAALLGALLLLLGVGAALQISLMTGLFAMLIALLALVYDAWGKHHPILGPLNMGLCRGSNLLLGISVVPSLISDRGFLGLIPTVYIAAVTLISRGEVEGGQRRTGAIALVLLVGVLVGILALGTVLEYRVLWALPFWLLLTVRVLPPFVRATANPSPEFSGRAVKAGVLSLIVLNASLAAGFAGWGYGLLTLSLLPLSLALARRFAVT